MGFISRAFGPGTEATPGLHAEDGQPRYVYSFGSFHVVIISKRSGLMVGIAKGSHEHMLSFL